MALYIREARKKAGYSQKELADMIGVAANTFNGYESGKHDPRPELLAKIAEVCGVSTDYLLGLTNHMDTKKTSSLSEEAHSVARRFENLDARGQGSILAAIAFEETFLPDNKKPSKSGAQENCATVYRRAEQMSDFTEIIVYEQPAAAGLGNYLSEPDYRIERFPEEEVPDGTDFGIKISGHSMEPEIPNKAVVFVRAAPSVEPGKIGIFVLNGQAYCKKLVVDRENGTVLLRSLNKEYGDMIIGEGDDLRTVGLVLKYVVPVFE